VHYGVRKQSRYQQKKGEQSDQKKGEVRQVEGTHKHTHAYTFKYLQAHTHTHTWSSAQWRRRTVWPRVDWLRLSTQQVL
jgi:ABC-type nickel/cobalt efflux system permease component RcnA